MPDTAQVNGQQLVLNGLALRKKLFVKVYVAGLYLRAKRRDAAAILAADSAAARRHELHLSVGSGQDLQRGLERRPRRQHPERLEPS